MLELKNITKNYYVGDQTVEALKGVSLSFRKSEFVSILGPSGCGKTTLLNIVGGLDRYTAGDLVINGVSTKLYGDSDWDSYRNHSVGFVFQNYNLITHQNVLSNVELALTLSGVNPQERKDRAVEALTKVGLSDQLKKLPAQLSGGQMQRVAIARALVNDPDIILADEPTGALDTETSVQIMQLLKEISKDKLVVMVTHNPELANEYSTRIINLKDGLIRDDSNPYECTNAEKIEVIDKAVNEQKTDVKKQKKPSMGLLTALSLSLKNLGTKKARTFLTSFAGSIGIIGIALILSLSAGFNGYINNVQKDTLSNYPVTIENSSMDMTSFISAFMGSAGSLEYEKYPDSKEIIANPMLESIMSSYTQSYGSNDLSLFKAYLDEQNALLDKNKISTIQYGYKFNMNLYQETNGSFDQVNEIGPMSDYMPENIGSDLSELFTPYYTSFKSMMATNNSWDEMLGSEDLLKSQYDLLAGNWPTFTQPKAGESWPLIVVVDSYNSIPDYALYMMGILTDEDVRYIFSRMALNMKYSNNKELVDNELKTLFPAYEFKSNFSFDDVIGKKYQVLLNGEFYEHTSTTEITETAKFNNYKKNTDKAYLDSLLANNNISLEIVGVVRQKSTASGGALSKNMYYTPALTQKLLEKTLTLDAVKDQLAYTNINVGGETGSWDVLNASFRADGTDSSSIHNTYNRLGIAQEDKPNSISIYPTSFENKDYVISLIDDYNKGKPEEEQIKYTDYLGMMMQSVTDIINAITYVLIAFVSISLIVSSIMIGVITYISVLERTKEIGILRSIGASKRDIARVFNAETIIVGFIAGALGIIITVILNIPISLIIEALAGIAGVSSLPPLGGLALVIISVVLTLVAGIIPSHIASKKDPVVALRSE